MESDFDVWTRVAIPVLTFVIGALVTFLVQRYWRTRDAVAQSAKALAELTADWYNQLDELRKQLNDRVDSTDAADLIDGYLRNRLILPKVLYHIAVLRDRHAHPQLVSRVEAFLSSVTSYDPLMKARQVHCRWLFKEPPNDADARTSFLSTLHKLDEDQQAVAREAARR